MRTGLTSMDKNGIKYEPDWTKQRFQWITIINTYEFSGLIKEWNF
jgi:hypothetical protein